MTTSSRPGLTPVPHRVSHRRSSNGAEEKVELDDDLMGATLCSLPADHDHRFQRCVVPPTPITARDGSKGSSDLVLSCRRELSYDSDTQLILHVSPSLAPMNKSPGQWPSATWLTSFLSSPGWSDESPLAALLVAR
jgi:hypothetical protein